MSRDSLAASRWWLSSLASSFRRCCSTASRLSATTARLYCLSSTRRAKRPPLRSILSATCRPGDSSSRTHPSMFCHGVEQLLEWILKEFYGVGQQFVGHFFHRNARSFKIGHGLLGAGDVLGKAVTQFAVVAKCIKCSRRDGVHSICADQFFDVNHIAILGIFSASAGP